MSDFLLVNGPNLNLLGTREPDVYGADRLADIEARCVEAAKATGHSLVCFQSNAEHELIDRVQASFPQSNVISRSALRLPSSTVS